MPRDSYTPGHSANAGQFMALRRASTHAAFFLPHLKPGMTVLDCGCGPGSITVGLAEAAAPGRVTGVDFAASQIELAVAEARQRNAPNAEFKTGTVYELPFPASAFDAVFSHALFEHLREPLKAVHELRRVLKPGGVIGLCSPDWGGFLISPSDAVLDEAIAFYKSLQQANGGDPNAGRKLGALLREAPFARVTVSASYEIYEDPKTIAEYLALRMEASPALDGSSRQGSMASGKTSAMAQALRSWSQHPDALFAQAWVAAVGHRE